MIFPCRTIPCPAATPSICAEGAGYAVYDMGSTNGTYTYA